MSHPIERNTQRGMSLVLVAAILVVLLGISALAIDLAALYVRRNEAQRAADAAALAGAKKFVESGFLSGAVPQTTAQSLATTEAIQIGAQNLVGGQPADIQPGDITFDFSNPTNPLITVVVQRTAARGTAVPTFFGKALGFAEVDISATATAEAYSPSGGNTPVGTGCMKPWMLPNCDEASASPENPNCPGSAYFVDPTTGAIVNPGPVSSGGVIGQNITLKPGNPGEAPAPSQFYPIQIPPGEEPAICPPCASEAGGSDGPGAALYRRNIACCNTSIVSCGQEVTLDRQTGNMVGPTAQGVSCLIHQKNNTCGGNPSACGQDFIQSTTNYPFPIMGGDNNPNPLVRGQQVISSDSFVTVPLYNGAQLCPGGADTCGTATISGFLQVFVEKAGPQGKVTGYVTNIAGCGAGGSGGGSGSGGGEGEEGGSGGGGTGSGGSGAITGPGGSLFPVRLVRPAN